jgi:hypothetical protein
MHAACNHAEYSWMLLPGPEWDGSEINHIGQDGTGERMPINCGPDEKQVLAQDSMSELGA